MDAIFIERILEVNSSFTELEQYTGFLNTVSFQMKFRVMCQQDYYGVDCNVFCLAQSDDVNGHYTCDRNGSIQCLEGFENPNNSCRDSKLKFEVLLSKFSYNFHAYANHCLM